MQVSVPLMKSGNLLPRSLINEYSTLLINIFFLWPSWWALLTAPLPFCLKGLGFHQLKKSRQGQGRWMTSMASRYFQGRVIETNEPCYISWDTEFCCSKIQSLTELKLEAPNLSTDHCVMGAQERRAFSKGPALLGSLLLFTWTAFVFSMWALFYVQALTHTHTHKHTHTHTQSSYLAFNDFLVLSSRCREQIKVRQSHYLIHIQCPWLLVT